MSPDHAVMPGHTTRGSTQLPEHFASMYDGNPTSVGLYLRVPSRWFCRENWFASTETFRMVAAPIR